jgi:hypothetical protein
MRRALALFLLTLPALPVMVPGAMAADLPVRSVTLSSAGLAQIERAGPLAAGEDITFRAPTDAIDDLLKSLVVRDASGGSPRIRLPAQDLAAEALRGLPLRAEDFASRAAMLNALRGQRAVAAGQAGLIASASEEAGVLRLSLLTPEGTVTVKVEDGAPIRLEDAALNTRIARAATALAAASAESEREIRIELGTADGRPGAAREVGVTYVAGAPLWKPSWRLLVPPLERPGEARLQGWAVVENRSGADWENIRLSLVSGDAAAFRQALYTPVLVPRPELPVQGSAPVDVTADTGAMPPLPMPAAPVAPAPRAFAERSRAAAPSPPPEPAQAAPSPGRVAFTLGAPVNLRNGETANLPFADTALVAERVWWVQDAVSRHPLQAVRLVNTGTATLPGGLATVYGMAGTSAEAGGYLGDAEITALPPRDMRIVAFARDRDVLITRTTERRERPTGIVLRGGALRVAYLVEDTVLMAIDPRGARGRLVVDLPARPGAKPDFPVSAEGSFGLRHEAVLERVPTTMRLPFQTARQRDIPLWDTGLGDPAVISWRDVDVEQQARRLPGGPGTLETLRDLLATAPEGLEGRATLATLTEDMVTQRRLLEEFLTARRASLSADAALERARAAAEDRTGAAREQARQRLNQASEEAERRGAAADTAWEAWRQGARTLLGRAG